MAERDDRADIAAAERALYRAMIARDLAALDAMLADDAVYIHSTAVGESKQGYLDGVRGGGGDRRQGQWTGPAGLLGGGHRLAPEGLELRS